MSILTPMTDLEKIVVQISTRLNDPYAIIDFAEQESFSAEGHMWNVCYASSLIVGRFSDKTRELADRLGKSESTIQFYAKAWRVRDYVKDESVPCSLHMSGITPAEMICKNLTFTHYGMIHRKVFFSKREGDEMTYIPIMTAKNALSWLAECVEPLMEDQKRLSPQALMEMMTNSPNTTQWFEDWMDLVEKIQNFVLAFSEYMPEGLRKKLAELIQDQWDRWDKHVTEEEN